MQSAPKLPQSSGSWAIEAWERRAVWKVLEMGIFAERIAISSPVSQFQGYQTRRCRRIHHARNNASDKKWTGSVRVQSEMRADGGTELKGNTAVVTGKIFVGVVQCIIHPTDNTLLEFPSHISLLTRAALVLRFSRGGLGLEGYRSQLFTWAEVIGEHYTLLLSEEEVSASASIRISRSQAPPCFKVGAVVNGPLGSISQRGAFDNRRDYSHSEDAMGASLSLTFLGLSSTEEVGGSTEWKEAYSPSSVTECSDIVGEKIHVAKECLVWFLVDSVGIPEDGRGRPPVTKRVVRVQDE
ncbi:hypothetical protein ARMGADRAFT_1031042 [Armillaria gallica]|uniref:Uncharacterized protein n=1 Tax=Armillaria gallica TaxID=47427 RepID=A0A2H3DA39_ARMGA|nr:hypothetical protein ARMGADRAFT_1031042 [Armillaria gallica]